MPLSVLYIGGTGQISLPCVEASVAAGHKVTVLNRGKTAVPLPKGVKTLVGDMNDAAYADLGDRRFDVVAQFRLFTAGPDAARHRDLHRQDRPVCLHLVGIGLREAGPALHDDREDAAGQSAIGNTAATRSPARSCFAIRTRSPRRSSARATRCARACRSSSAIRMRDPPDDRRQARDRRRRRLFPLDADAVGRCRGPFVRLFGNAKALGEDFHITTDRGFTWNQIHEAIARGFGVEAIHAHVPTDDAGPPQQGMGRPADGRQDLDGPLRQFQGQERRRAVRGFSGPR